MYVYVNIFFFKQKTAYEMRISDWSSDVCSSDLFDAFYVLISTVIVFFLGSQSFLTFDPLTLWLVQVGVMMTFSVLLFTWLFGGRRRSEIGRASCRERVCQYV